MDKRYTVAQACSMVGVKSYVLRYWEDELSLRINRNELGHRYYTGYDIQLFLNIKELKNRGLQLRAIKDLIPRLACMEPGSAGSKIKLIKAAPETGTAAGGQASQAPDPVSQIPEDEDEARLLEFQQILERLIAQEIHFKKEGEDHCRSLDAAIRRQQLARKEAAAGAEKRSSRRQKRHR